MLTVDEHDPIRRKHLVDGMSQRAIAQELGYARNTVAKAIAYPIPPGCQLSKPRPKPAIDPVKHIIDAWLEQEKLGRPKQRHTGQRVYERLCDELNFKDSATAVRRYIRESKQYSQEVFRPLAFEPGEEALVDWHEGWIEENGVQRKAQFFCMRLSYSKASFVWSYERANLESFLDDHVRAMEYFGGVPRRLAYDNLKSAVVQVGKGRDRRLNKRFRELRSWCLFDTRFCNVARGNEKGDVENLAKRSERTYLTPIPAVGALAELGPCCSKTAGRIWTYRGPNRTRPSRDANYLRKRSGASCHCRSIRSRPAARSIRLSINGRWCSSRPTVTRRR